MTNKIRLYASWATALALAAPNFAAAQNDTSTITPNPSARLTPRSSSGLEQIVVTARKRKERLSDTPVAIIALTSSDLQKKATNDYKQLASQVPSLQVATNVGATGAQISLRGISAGTYSANADQAVSTNIDGIQISKGLVANQGFFDLGQVEVLKGPQALFFGKNSPGGILSLTTASPSDTFEAFYRQQYDFNQRMSTEEAVVSGPIANGFKARLAMQYNSGEGYYSNEAEDPSYSRVDRPREFIGRFTGVYDNGGPFKATLKYSYDNTRTTNDIEQYFSCPKNNFLAESGVENAPFNCTNPPGTRVYSIKGEPALLDALPTVFPANGLPYNRVTSNLLSFNAEYNFGPVTLTSVTGYYNPDRHFFTTSASYLGTQQNTADNIEVDSASTQKYAAASQEVRLTSHLSGPLQFVVGGYFQNEADKVTNSAVFDLSGYLTALHAVPVPVGLLPIADRLEVVEPYFHNVDANTYSTFAQAQYTIVPTLTLSAGVRWTAEHQTMQQLHPIPDTTTGGLPGGTFTGLVNDAYNASPEATLSWKPQPGQLYYASYKQGFLAGGFNTSEYGATSGSQLSYQPETVQGFEGGTKFVLDQNHLNLDVAAYRYDYRGLQQSFEVPGTISLEVVNSGLARIEGLEFNASWAPRLVNGLRLNGGINYNHARYVRYTGQCYGAQTPGTGCNLDFDSSPTVNAYTEQNYAGKQLPNAPDITANVGADYGADLIYGWTYGLSGDVVYTGRYNAYSLLDPRAEQRASARLDASVRLYSPGGRFDIAFIGQNLTNSLRAVAVTSSPLTSLGTGTPHASPDVLGGWFNPPVTLIVQATLHY